MIAPASAFARAFARIGPATGFARPASLPALRAALREADHLADDVYDVPAALLFGFGRNARCFEAFRMMSVLAIEWQAKTLGFKLEATPSELGEMLVRVAAHEVSYEDVRAWMGSRLLPFGG